MFIENIEATIKSKGVIFDTELLLVVCIGIKDQNSISRNKRTSSYDKTDFNNFINILRFAGKRFVSPQILGELTNFVDDLTEPLRSEVLTIVKELCNGQEEIYVEKEILLKNRYWFFKTGFSDTSLLQICKDEKCVLFSSDFKLTGLANKAGLTAINYRNLQGQRWKV